METSLVLENESTDIVTPRAVYRATRVGSKARIVLAHTNGGDPLDVEFETSGQTFRNDARGVADAWEVSTFVTKTYVAGSHEDLAKMIDRENERFYTGFVTTDGIHCLAITGKQGMAV